jgi:hypothetical protein
VTAATTGRLRRAGPRVAALRSIVAAGFACALTGSAVARADDPTKAQCVEANESAQALRQDGKLRAARAQLLICLARTCPGPVRDDCAQRITEVERAAPTIVIIAKSQDGNALRAVQITMDDVRLADHLDGSALVVDAGAHMFWLVADGYARVAKKLFIREGVKGRREVVTLESTQPPSEAQQVPAPAPLVVTRPPVNPEVDEGHPRFAVELFGGFGFASSFGNDSAGWCANASRCTQTSAAAGPRAGVTGVYEFPSGLGGDRAQVFVQGGYLSLSRGMSRDFAATFKAGPSSTFASYTLKDDVRVSGPFTAAGVGYRVGFSESFDVQLRLSMGAAFVKARDIVTGTLGDDVDHHTLATSTDGSGLASDAVMLIATPEIAGGFWFGKNVRVTAGAAFAASLLTGPRMNLGFTRLNEPARDSCTNVNTIECAPDQKLDPNLSAYGQFVTIVSQLTVGYWF